MWGPRPLPEDALDLLSFDFTTYDGLSSKSRALLLALDLLAFRQWRCPSPVCLISCF